MRGQFKKIIGIFCCIALLFGMCYTIPVSAGAVNASVWNDFTYWFEEGDFYKGNALKKVEDTAGVPNNNQYFSYSSAENKFSRNKTGGWQNYNVAWMFTNETYETFALTFDVKFCVPTGLDPWVWIEFGKQELGKTTNADKADGATVTSVLSTGKDAANQNNKYAMYDQTIGGNGGWGNSYPGLDIDKTHQVRMIVDKAKNYYVIFIDGNRLGQKSLTAGYKSGYVGIGTGCGEITVSNIKIDSQNPAEMFEAYSPYSTANTNSYFLGNMTAAQYDQWIYTGNGMITRDNLAGTGALYSNETYNDDFVMTFDYSLGRAYANDVVTRGFDTLYVGFGATDKGEWLPTDKTLKNPSPTIIGIYNTGEVGYAPTGTGADGFLPNGSGKLFAKPDQLGARHTAKIVVKNKQITVYIDGKSQGARQMQNYAGGHIFIGCTKYTTAFSVPVIYSTAISEQQENTFVSYSTNVSAGVYKPAEFEQDSTLSKNWYSDENGMIHKGSSDKCSVLYLKNTSAYNQNIRITVPYKTTVKTGNWGAFVGFGAPEQGADWYSGQNESGVNLVRIHTTGAVGYFPHSAAGDDGWVLREIKPTFDENEYENVHTLTLELKYGVCYVRLDDMYAGTHQLVNYNGGYIFLGAYNSDVAFGIPAVENITPVKRGSSSDTPYGKTALFVGDSISAGTGDLAAWANRLGYHFDMQTTNKSVGGMVVAIDSACGRDSILTRLESQIGTEYDYVIVEGGINDIMQNTNINASYCTKGDITTSYNPQDFDTSTFAGALEKIMYTATTQFGSARVGYVLTYKPIEKWIGNWETAEQYIAAAKAICEKWNVNYLNLWDDTELNTELHSNTEKYMADGLHLTDSGYDYIDAVIADWFKGLTVTEYAGYGHVNGDGVIDIRDLVAMKKLIGSNGSLASADLNKDKSVNSLDMTLMRKYLLGIIDKL